MARASRTVSKAPDEAARDPGPSTPPVPLKRGGESVPRRWESPIPSPLESSKPGRNATRTVDRAFKASLARATARITPAGVATTLSRRSYQMHTHREADPYIDPDTWRQTIPTQTGSWWPAWQAWLAERSSAQVEPPKLGTDEYPPLMDAPGCYVLQD